MGRNLGVLLVVPPSSPFIAADEALVSLVPAGVPGALTHIWLCNTVSCMEAAIAMAGVSGGSSSGSVPCTSTGCV